MGLLIRSAAIAFAFLPALFAAQRPSFIAEPGRVAAIALPASLLSDPDVDHQLASGLTTTFLLVARDGRRRGAARIEIRFDLWDEVWIVRRIEIDGREDRQRIASREALEKWWSSPTRVFVANADRVSLNTTLTVLPFSAAEGEDARRWISRSGPTAAGEPLVEALMGTTFDAKPIRSFHWQTDMTFR